jgi:hypothetical protein
MNKTDGSAGRCDVGVEEESDDFFVPCHLHPNTPADAVSLPFTTALGSGRLDICGLTRFEEES